MGGVRGAGGGGEGSGAERGAAEGGEGEGSVRAAPSARPSGCGAARDPRRAALRGGRGYFLPSRLFTA